MSEYISIRFTVIHILRLFSWGAVDIQGGELSSSPRRGIVSLRANAIGKGMNTSILLLAYREIVGQLGSLALVKQPV